MDGYIVDLIILSFTYLTIYVYFNFLCCFLTTERVYLEARRDLIGLNRLNG